MIMWKLISTKFIFHLVISFLSSFTEQNWYSEEVFLLFSLQPFLLIFRSFKGIFFFFFALFGNADINLIAGKWRVLTKHVAQNQFIILRLSLRSDLRKVVVLRCRTSVLRLDKLLKRFFRGKLVYQE